MVMYAGQVAEFGDTREVFDTPRHPYSVGLLEAFPSITGERVPLTGIPGRPPDLSQPQQGCWFAPRCPQVREPCTHTLPELYPVAGVTVRCLRYGTGTGWAEAAAQAVPDGGTSPLEQAGAAGASPPEAQARPPGARPAPAGGESAEGKADVG
jgi:oligopeptide/dipeptide ABC transporter ATP-binding protein